MAALLRRCLVSNASRRTFDGLRAMGTSSGEGPVYVVFGATGAVGSALVKLLASQQNANVVASAREQEVEEVEDSSVADTVDMFNSEAVAAVVKSAADRYGRIDGVANCVGAMLIKPAHLTSDEEFMHQLQTNTVSAFNVVKASVKAMMKTGGGSVALCSSAIAHRGYANHEAVAASKGGVVGLMLSAAATYAPHNIRVNCAVPGLTKSKMAKGIVQSESAHELSARMHALGRIGEPEEVARALEFLLHPQNSFVTGSTLHVDGGLGNVAPVDAGSSKA